MHICERDGYDTNRSVFAFGFLGKSSRGKQYRNAEYDEYMGMLCHRMRSGKRDWNTALPVFVHGGKNGAEGGTRTPMGCPTRPSNVRVYQFHHFGMPVDVGQKTRDSTMGKIIFCFLDLLPRKVCNLYLIFSLPAVSRVQE